MCPYLKKMRYIIYRYNKLLFIYLFFVDWYDSDTDQHFCLFCFCFFAKLMNKVYERVDYNGSLSFFLNRMINGQKMSSEIKEKKRTKKKTTNQHRCRLSLFMQHVKTFNVYCDFQQAYFFRLIWFWYWPAFCVCVSV